MFIVVPLSLSCVNEFDATPVKTVNGSSNESTRTLADSVSSVNMVISAMGAQRTRKQQTIFWMHLFSAKREGAARQENNKQFFGCNNKQDEKRCFTMRSRRW